MFVAYLWGIETGVILSILITLAVFVAYLWGIETKNGNVGYLEDGSSL